MPHMLTNKPAHHISYIDVDNLESSPSNSSDI
jgi:hypothetical protein